MNDEADTTDNSKPRDGCSKVLQQHCNGTQRCTCCGELRRDSDRRDGGQAYRAMSSDATEAPPTLADMGLTRDYGYQVSGCQHGFQG
jgi:hypothetical protein